MSSPKNILYVDDERSNLNAFRLLYRRKFNILTAESAEQALDLLERENIQLLITDQRMPGMTGTEFLKIVRNRRPRLKSILLTAYSDHETLKEAVNEGGIFWYLNKPFDKDQMELIIQKGIEAMEYERQVSEKEEKFQRVVENLIEGFYISSWDGALLTYNKEFEKMLGLTQGEDYTGTRSTQFWKNQHDRSQYLSALKESGFIKDFITQLNTLDGRSIFVRINARVRQENPEGAQQIEGVILDITDQKKAEEQKAKSREEIFQYQKRLKDLVTELTITEEIQRKKIATDLHDQVGQLLASVRLQLAAIDQHTKKEVLMSRLKNISEDCLKGIQAVRTAIFDLTYPQLHDIGLFAATSDWLEQVGEKYHIQTQIDGADERFAIEENTRLLLFRSIRELLMNVVKHAEASLIQVHFEKSGHGLIIRIMDNGVGFEFNLESSKFSDKGFGLFSILERIKDIGGRMDIQSSPGEGSVVSLKVPMKKGELEKLPSRIMST